MKILSTVYIKIRGIFSSSNYWKVAGLGLLIALIGLLLGMAFLLILVGVFSLLLRWTPYWRPAHKLFGKLSLANSDNFNPLKGWIWVQFILTTIPPLLLILGGIFILTRTGFENQNLIFLQMNR
jgi:hypothetical protein